MLNVYEFKQGYAIKLVEYPPFFIYLRTLVQECNMKEFYISLN